MLNPTGTIFSQRTVNFRKLQHFYTGLLGSPKACKADQWAAYALPGGQFILWSQVDFKLEGDGALELCLTVTDLDQAHEQLAADYQPSAIQSASHGREFFIKDPDGNRIIVYQPLLS